MSKELPPKAKEAITQFEHFKNKEMPTDHDWFFGAVFGKDGDSDNFVFGSREASSDTKSSSSTKK